MPIPISERYKLIFQEHQFSSDYRIKIITGWCTIYAALAVVFVWVQKTIPNLSWFIPVIGIAITVLMWAADYRNRAAIGRSKEVGKNIEKAEEIPEQQQYFSNLNKGFSHSITIDIFAGISILLLLIATFILICNGGHFPTQ